MNEDDPIVGDTINSSPSNFEAFEAIFKARFARLVIASFRSFQCDFQPSSFILMTKI